ncbi:hypothetical protein SAMN04515674_106154 [Pseudarcicella hirudinis]|uniref:Class IIb bacteriocin, lactobin A/cerein 7B family n=1 Tax=Pseudarcicella hirudinis TaxID=1079859 RepID=A0A1I5TQF0_9BACT|nr:hypothetical protein [Pseudarcicella hirudinis]SFP85280.1 hypothetical protein SAMN04515674_106154 [Pseudarcicella hirudinis]
MNTTYSLDLANFNVSAISASEMEVISGGITAYEAGYYAGKAVIAICTVAALFL